MLTNRNAVVRLDKVYSIAKSLALLDVGCGHTEQENDDDETLRKEQERTRNHVGITTKHKTTNKRDRPQCE